MRKRMFWFGLIVVVLGGFGFTMTSNPAIPVIYGTNQAYWGIAAVIGAVIIILGLVLRKRDVNQALKMRMYKQTLR